MRVVIQCAGDKRSWAGRMKTDDGRSLRFVAHPEEVAAEAGLAYARPDDVSENGETWRERVRAYNANPEGNPLELLPAYRLYSNRVYRDLASHIGTDRLFILSAGWGLIRAEFLTPSYDSTFRPDGMPGSWRTSTDSFDDWSMVDGESSEPLVFLGGESYFPFFGKLTDHCRCKRVAYHRLKDPPRWDGVEVRRYETKTRTNWYYGAVKALIEGSWAPLD